MDRSNKIAFMLLRLKEGRSDMEIRQAIDVPRRTYFLWKSRINSGEYAQLVNRQKPGPKPMFELDNRAKKLIMDCRRKYGWGPTKIEGHLDVHHNIHVPHNRIYQLIKQKNLNNAITQQRRTWGKRRWERQHSMSLWQVDYKDVNSDTEEPMLTFYDDHSRFVTASRRFEEATMENAIKLAGHAFRKWGIPEQLLADNGSQFKNNQSDQLTEFELFCLGKGVKEVIHSTKNRPTTLGKIENFHGQYDKESWRFKTHAAYMVHWNYYRPNGGIGYLYPCERFFKDRKSASNSG